MMLIIPARPAIPAMEAESLCSCCEELPLLVHDEGGYLYCEVCDRAPDGRCAICEADDDDEGVEVESSMIPEDAVGVARIEIVEYADHPEEGDLAWDASFLGDVPLSTLVGLLELAKDGLIERGADDGDE